MLGGHNSRPAAMRILLVLKVEVMYDFEIEGEGGEEGAGVLL